jgi:enamine deaminase RidA (YjgF/YER057c/UK114 family)
MSGRHWAPSPRAQETVPVQGNASTVVMYAGMCWTSSLTGASEGDAAELPLDVECRRALQRLRSALSTVGTVLDDVLMLTVALRDPAEIAVFDQVMAEFFTAPYPARTLIGAPLHGTMSVSAQAVCRAEAVLRRVGADRVSKETLI